MARRKPDAEVGPLGVWAYNTARLLGRSSEQVAEAVGVSDVTIRKIEGGSNRKPGAALLRRIYGYFQKLSADQGIPIDPPPGLLAVVERMDDPVADAIRAQTKVMKDLADAIWATLGGRPTSDPLEADLRASALAGDAEAARRAGNPRQSDPAAHAHQPGRLPPGNGSGS